MPNVKQINAKLKALYENREPDYLEENDKWILGRERAGLAQKEYWANASAEVKQLKSLQSKQNNIKHYGKATYVVRSPGRDLLDFYDAQWHIKNSNDKNNILPIPPSLIYKFRYQTEKPKGRGNNQSTGITISDVFKETCKPYADHFPSWKVGKHPQFYPWLTDQLSVQKTFQLRAHAVEYLTQIKGSIQRGISIVQHGDDQVLEQLFWKGPLKGYSIILEQD